VAVQPEPGVPHGVDDLTLADVLRATGQTPEGVIRQAREMIERTGQALSGSLLQEVFLPSHWLQKVEEMEQKL